MAADYDGLLLKCERAPELCDVPVTSTVREEDLSTAIDIVFVGDGFPRAELSNYQTRVSTLMEELSANVEGIVGRDPALFNFHRIDLVSESATPSERPLRSCVNAGRDDTGWFLVADTERVQRVADNAPDADVVIVLTNGSPESRGPAGDTRLGTQVIFGDESVSHRILTHELGHALMKLRDEYVDFDEEHWLAGRYETWTENPAGPNLSLSPTEGWGDLVEGTVEGGGRFATGIYRPTDNCRMLEADGTSPFCPVCSHEVDRMLRGRRGAQDGPPLCGLAVGFPAPEGGDNVPGLRELEIFARDGNGIMRIEFEVDELPPGVLDSAANSPLASSLPIGQSLSTVVARSATIRCTDGMGLTSESHWTSEP